MAGAFHGVGEPEAVLNVGVSGPGVVRARWWKSMPQNADLGAVAETIKRTAFKITRVGELVGREAAAGSACPSASSTCRSRPRRPWATQWRPSSRRWASSACGGPGTTAALALLNDAVKKGGAMASAHVGGLSGAFIPVSEDAGMIAAARAGALTLEKLEAMTASARSGST